MSSSRLPYRSQKPQSPFSGLEGESRDGFGQRVKWREVLKASPERSWISKSKELGLGEIEQGGGLGQKLTSSCPSF